MGWANQTGIHSSTLFSATINLPEVNWLIPHNYGLIYADIGDTSINDISPRPLQDGGGQVLYLSGDKLTAYVTAVLPSPELPEYTAVQRFGGESIHTWIDDQESSVLRLPEDIRWASTEDIFPHRVGENGLLVLSSYKQDRSHTLDSFAVYHTTRREWKLIPAAGHR